MGDDGEERYIEFNAVIGPIDPPYQLHTFDGDGPHATTHGVLAERLHDAVADLAPKCGTSAQVVTEAEMERRAEADVENRRLREAARQVCDVFDGWVRRTDDDSSDLTRAISGLLAVVGGET